MRNETIEWIDREKIIVIVRGVDRDKLIPLTEAVYDGGIRLLEITFDASGKVSDKEIADDIALLARTFEGKMLFGAGTVLTEAQVDLVREAGGRFIISPDTNPAVITRTREAGLVSIPGALTPTEAQTAHRAGADYVKLFPVSVMGPGYVKALTAPLSHIRFTAVGGVDENNMNDYFSAGACGIGIGSNVVDKKCIAAGDYAAITAKARLFTERLK